MQGQVRVRYAPSPTGFQHIGGVRTALFNYLLARSTGGAFILRVEDTDRERYAPEALQDIYDTFAWLGLRWDEGPDVGGPCAPYLQSQRLELYRSHAERLVSSGLAYRCYCSAERLAALRQEQSRSGRPQGYDRRCRDLNAEQRREHASQGSVVRLKVPLEGSTAFQDELLGRIETPNCDVNPDPVLLKSDGFPTYHLANVVDDHLMGVTHILRAQEWLPSTPLHVLLYTAFGWQPPRYCHLPMVLGQDGQKLSKRHGATRVIEFRQKGYLPEALVNYTALLGWSFDDSREFFSLDELKGAFSLARLNKSPAVFDYKKLDWFNGMYIRRIPAHRLAELLLPHLQAARLISGEPTAEERRKLEGLVPLVQERLTLLCEAPEMVRYLFEEPPVPAAEELVPKRLNAARTGEVLRQVTKVLQGLSERPEAEVEESLRGLADSLGVKLGELLMPVRLAVTGSRVSPPLLQSLRLLGEEQTLARLGRAIQTLGA
jgi:glutamyl-tRNA synthetase